MNRILGLLALFMVGGAHADPAIHTDPVVYADPDTGILQSGDCWTFRIDDWTATDWCFSSREEAEKILQQSLEYRKHPPIVAPVVPARVWVEVR